MPIVQADDLQRYAIDLFLHAGTDADTADLVAASLVRTNLTGHDSHGVVRIPQYLEDIESGTINPTARPTLASETAVLAHVDGQWALGQVVADYAIRVAIEKAQEQGIAGVGLYHSGHIGRLGEWVEIAARANLVALGFCNGSRYGGIVTPHGGAERTLGTNPIAAGLPVRNREPLVVDFATSGVAEGKVRVARNAGKEMAPGYILDSTGLPTVNPYDLYDGGMLLPVGRHKGYGLGLMMEFLGGLLTGRGTPRFDDYQSGNGALFMVMRADAFRPLDDYLDDAERMCEIVLGVRVAPGSDGVLLPGDPERIMTSERQIHGIPIDDGTWTLLMETGAKYDVKWPENASMA